VTRRYGMTELDGAVRRCLPLSEWPERDRAAWAAAHHRGGLLDDDGLAASWAPATSAIIAGGYGRFLSFLAQTGDLAPHESPATRISRARVEAYIAELRERNHSSTVAGRLLQLVRAAAVMAPNTDWIWLRRIRARVHRMATPARDDRTRLVPATTVVNLGLQLMERAEAKTGLSARQQALLFRDGLMICVLSACSVRARNVAAMSIGTSVQRRGDEWWVSFGPGETKNRRPFQVPLPASFTASMERYISQYRPRLVRCSPTPVAGDALWISDGGKPLTAKEVGQRISAVTKRELGRDLNPHLFRKICPTELAIRNPEHVGIAQPLLGHADYRMTQQFYNLGRALDAAKRHHRVVEAIRGGIEATPRPIKSPRTGAQSTGRTPRVIRKPRRSSRKDTR
jgi:integrase/recombinase XerD